MLLLGLSDLASAATFALLINGGDQPETNYPTHLEHLREVHQTLVDRGIAPHDIAVFSADGTDQAPDTTVGLVDPDPNAWLVEGTSVAALVPRYALVDSTWDGVDVHPATAAGLGRWFAHAAERIRPGDTLLIYVTDHGRKGTDSVEDASIALWREQLSVAEFRDLLQTLHPETRVLVTMSQCYAGSFAAALYPVDGEQPADNRCGFFAAPADRPSYGCYPEAREQPIGHGFRWSEALGRRSSLLDAHDEVLLTDRSPDVPVTSSDVHIQRMLRTEARRRGVLPETLTDTLLAESLAAPTEAANELRARIHDLAATIGSGTPLDLAEARRLQIALPDTYDGLLEGARMWGHVAQDARDRNLAAFLDENPVWVRRLARAPELDAARRHALRDDLAAALQAWTPPTEAARIADLVARQEAARQGAWRTAVREAIALRMTWLLRRIAADQLLASDLPHLAADRAALEALTGCETVAPGRIPGHAAALTTPDQGTWPPLVDDLAVLETVTAPWLGATFGPVSRARTAHLGLPAGAVALHVVFPDSPADRAGLLPGDVLIGPADRRFETASGMTEWLMASPRGVPLPMTLWRGYLSYDTEIALRSWADRAPEPARPADRLPEVRWFDLAGEPLPPLEGPHLLFFWATWCGPCKAAAPEVVAWSQQTGVPVIAVTDEGLAAVTLWQRRNRSPFPTIALDPDRAAHTALAIEELPTFVHVGVDGAVLARQQGYSSLQGLFP